MATSTPATAETLLPSRKSATPALSRDCFKLRESVNNVFRIVVPRGITRERLLDSDFYATVAGDLTAFDKIIAVAADRSFYCELLVLECGRSYANLVELSYTPLPALLVVQGSLPANHEIIHLGPTDLYAVRRISDQVLLGKGFSSREEAVAFLCDHASLR